MAELPQPEIRGEQEPAGTEVLPLLRAISGSFHLYALRRPGSIALQRRFTTPLQLPRVELAELSAAAADVNRLLADLAPDWEGVQESRDHNRFWRILSADQIAAMRNGTVPFSALNRSQQELWLKVNRWNAFGHEQLGSGRAAKLFAQWKHAELAYETHQTIVGHGVVEPRMSLWLRYPDRGDASGLSRESFPPAEWPKGGTTPSAISPAGDILPERMRALSGLDVPLETQDGEVTLGDLVNEMGRQTKRRIEIPEYARQRRLFAAVSGSKCVDVVVALEDLYGWETQVLRSRYSLTRPRLGPIGDLRRLGPQLMAAVPPPMRQTWRHESETIWQSRANVQRTLVLEDAARVKGRVWQHIRLTELSPRAQQELANYLFEGLLRNGRAADPTLPTYALHPESGYFHVDGSTENPWIKFAVDRGDGKADMWGWLVGSSSVKD